jgi:methylthioribose-1-phosphate isomerase
MEDDEEDYGALIYRESQLRKAEAATAAAVAAKDAKKKKEKEKEKDSSSADVSSTQRCATSTRKKSRPAAVNKPSVTNSRSEVASKRKRDVSSAHEEEQAMKKVVRRKCTNRKICTADGCTNQSKQGGVCRRHGAKVKCKQCSSDGCTNLAQKGGVCQKHGANKRCSIEGC